MPSMENIANAGTAAADDDDEDVLSFLLQKLRSAGGAAAIRQHLAFIFTRFPCGGCESNRVQF